MIKKYFFLFFMGMSTQALYSMSTALDGVLIADVFESEAGFTCATDAKPILATAQCSSCVAVAGYDGDNKTAFLVHVAHQKELSASGGELFSALQCMARNPITHPVQIYLRGGTKGMSQKIIVSIHTWLRSLGIPIKIVLEDVLHPLKSSQSLLIDSRTGCIAEYNPAHNPHRRVYTPADIARITGSNVNPTIRICYRPGGYSPHEMPIMPARL